MKTIKEFRAWSIIVPVFIFMALGLLVWSNYRYARLNPGGNDFLVHWVGTRSLLYEGISPYSDEVANEIQRLTYGRLALPGEHQFRVAYPLYSIYLFIPFSLINDFILARAIWMTTLEIALIMLSITSMKLCDFKPHLSIMVSFLIFSMIWYHAVRPLINGNAVIIIGLLIAAGLLALKNKSDEAAGVLFAFSTIKPQLVVLIIPYIILWALINKRYRFITWLVATMGLLILSASLFLPDWLIQNIIEVVKYPSYNPPGTLQAALNLWLPEYSVRLGWAITGLLAFLLLIEWKLSFNHDFSSFLWTAFLTLTASQWIGIQTDPGNFIILFPALVYIFKAWSDRWKHIGTAMIFGSMLILLLGLWILFVNTLDGDYQPLQSPVMFVPLPAFLLLMLYWVRWWSKKPIKLWYEEIQDLVINR